MAQNLRNMISNTFGFDGSYTISFDRSQTQNNIRYDDAMKIFLK